MSEASRARRQFILNRLEELNAKYGPASDALPDWLDHESEPLDADFTWIPRPVAEPVQAPAHWELDQYGETPVLACPQCGEVSAKANVNIDLWHCTACGLGGRINSWVLVRDHLKANRDPFERYKRSE